MKSKMMAALLGTFIAATALGQTNDGYKPAPGGILYKILPAGTGKALAHGNFFEIGYKVMYKDSVLANSDLYANSITVLDSASIPVAIYNIFAQCSMGDTVLTKTLTDSAFNGAPLPPGMERGQFIQATYTIANLFTTKEAADSAGQKLAELSQAKAEARAKEQAAADDKTIKNYLAVKGINAVKAPMGTYIETTVPGKGKKIDDKVEVKINYTGRTLAGKVFDSNTDPAFNHVEPISVKMWEPNVIAGWVEGLRYFTPGAKGRLYIPSGLGYGAQGTGGDIGPNEILIFDIAIVGVKSQPVDKPVVAVKPKAKPAAKKPVKKVVKKK